MVDDKMVDILLRHIHTYTSNAKKNTVSAHRKCIIDISE